MFWDTLASLKGSAERHGRSELCQLITLLDLDSLTLCCLELGEATTKERNEVEDSCGSLEEL